jgi:hypothetical protein
VVWHSGWIAERIFLIAIVMTRDMNNLGMIGKNGFFLVAKKTPIDRLKTHGVRVHK